MKQPTPPKVWFRSWLAAMVALIFLMILFPRSGRFVREPVTGYHLIEDRPQQMAIISFVLLVPVAIVYWGSKRNSKLEFVGWVLLIGLFSAAMVKTAGRPTDKWWQNHNRPPPEVWQSVEKSP